MDYTNDYDDELLRRMEKDIATFFALGKKYTSMAETLSGSYEKIKALQNTTNNERSLGSNNSFPASGSFLEQFKFIESKFVYPIMTTDLRKEIEKLAGKNAIPLSSMYLEIRKLVDSKKLIQIQVNESKKLNFFTTHEQYIIGTNGHARLIDDFKHPKIVELEQKGKFKGMVVTGR
jgi:hypothetical protein